MSGLSDIYLNNIDLGPPASLAKSNLQLPLQALDSFHWTHVKVFPLNPKNLARLGNSALILLSIIFFPSAWILQQLKSNESLRFYFNPAYAESIKKFPMDFANCKMSLKFNIPHFAESIVHSWGDFYTQLKKWCITSLYAWLWNDEVWLNDKKNSWM